MDEVELLIRAHTAGLTVRADGDELVVRGPRSAEALARELLEHKAEILAHLRRRTEMVDLPFPIGYKGLPLGQVEAAEAVMDKFGVTDPVLRKYNVMSWVRGYYQDRGENHGELYEAIKREQQRLGELLAKDIWEADENRHE